MSGKELRERRKKLGITQERLSMELQTNAGTVEQWERGEAAISAYVSNTLETLEKSLQLNKAPNK